MELGVRHTFCDGRIGSGSGSFEGDRVGRGVECELGRDPAADRTPIGLGCHRKLGRHPVVARLEIPLPAAPDDRVPVIQHEGVAHIGDRLGVVRGTSLEQAHPKLVASVGNVVEQGAVASRQVNRFQYEEIG